MVVFARTCLGALARYFPSSRARLAKIRWGMALFFFSAGRVSTDTAVTSEPVPQVVGMQTMGSGSVFAWASNR